MLGGSRSLAYWATSLAAGQFPNINDAPRDNPDIVYVNGTTLTSTVVGTLRDYLGNPLTGTWVDINQSGVLVFEKHVNGFYQVFKAYPVEPRIISTGGTTGQVGLPYKYSSDNIAQAYGGDPEPDDPRFISQLSWDIVPNPNNPPGFTINATTGKINWTPTSPGTYPVTIRANNFFLDDGFPQEDTQTLTITVTQPVIEVVDALDFRAPNSPDLLTTVDSYVSGGQPRVGVVADAASRLVLRVSLQGIDLTDSTLNLHFAIAGANVANDGQLLAIGSATWAADVPATLAAAGAAKKAVCLYESPLDYDAASKPVAVQLRNGNNVIATQTIQLRRPPVVLVHDQWSGPDEWSVLFDQLIDPDQGMDVFLFDYNLTAGAGFNANAAKILGTTTEAITLARQSGFAASRVDMIGHGVGGILARLHAQRYAQQLGNYNKGDMHKIITLGTPHQGSYIAGLVTTMQAANPTDYDSLRTAVMNASQANGNFPPADLSEGVLADETGGSTALADLDISNVPSHAISTTATALPPGDLFGLLHFALGAAIQGDGMAATASEQGGIADGAFTQFADVPHPSQPNDANVIAALIDLLKQPIATSGKFGSFAANRSLPAPPAVGAINLGNWLAITSPADGATVAPGQTVDITAAPNDARTVQSVNFFTPGGASSDAAAPFTFSFQVPNTIIGTITVLVAGTDANGQVAFASIALNVVPTATLESIEVETPDVTLTSKAPKRLRVWGNYSDAVRRDITAFSAGTRYTTSDRFTVRVDTSGVLRAVQSTVSPIIITINNGALTTQASVTVQFFNFPPSAIITANKTSGPAPLDIQFDASQSNDFESLAITYHWVFDDGTTSDLVTPPSHRFWVPGDHVVTLIVTDGQGLIGIDEFVVTVEDRLVVDGVTITLTEHNQYGQVTVLNNGNLSLTGPSHAGSLSLRSGSILTAPQGAALDLAVTGDLVVETGARVDVSAKGYRPGYTTGGQTQGASTGYAGGSFGGLGGVGGGVPAGVYGDFTNPNDFGSGTTPGGYDSPDGAGGGLIRISAGRIILDGDVLADGDDANGIFFGTVGGGAGGGIRLDAGVLEGGGLVRARGGSGTSYNVVSGSGGGGGRIAIYAGDLNAFGLERVTATGGSPNGGAGTVYLKKTSEPNGELIIDNGGTATAQWSTPLPAQGIVRLNSWTVSGDSRVSTPDRVYVATGNPAQFTSLITGGFLQVGGLIVNGTLVFGEADSDGDVLPDSYESAHGFDPNLASDASQDADGDGHTNLEEFLAGTDPRDAASFANRPPLARTDTMGAVEGRPTRVLVKKLLANDSDPDGDSLTLSLPSGNNAQGGTVTLSNGTVVYTPASGFRGSDSFIYEVSDGNGGTAQAKVAVTVKPALGIASNLITITPAGNGAMRLSFIGIPGRTYNIEVSTNLAVWNLLATLVAGANGEFEFVDNEAANFANRYYRLVVP